MKKKVGYYFVVLLLVLLVCVYVAFMWRCMSTMEVDGRRVGIYTGLFMFGALPFPPLAFVLGRLGVKCGAIEPEKRWMTYYIDNLIFTLLSPMILTVMGAYEIIAIQSGGDLSGIEFLLYLGGLLAVEGINFAICFGIQAVRCQKRGENGKALAYGIVPAVVIYNLLIFIGQMLI